MLVKIETKPKDTIIVQVNMPNSNSSNIEMKKVHKGIEKVIERFIGDENLIIMENWNGIVGKKT